MNSKPTVGVVGLPDVARAFAEAGFHVVTAPAFRDAAAEIKRALDTQKFPIITETLVEPGFLPWASSMSNRDLQVTVVETRGSVNTSRLPERVTRVQTPVTVNALAALASVGEVTGDPGAVTVAGEGAPLAAPAEPAPAPAAPAPTAGPTVVRRGASIVGASEPAPMTRRGLREGATQTQSLFDVTDAASTPATDTRPAPAEQPDPPRTPTASPYSNLFDVTSAPQESQSPYAGRHDLAAPAPAPAPKPEPEPAPRVLRPARGRTRLGDVVFTAAAKGGVWKTTTALQIAEAAAVTGRSVILIDGNRGQGDIRTALRLPSTAPGIIAAVDGDASGAVLTPNAVNSYRRGLTPVHFAVVLAPLRSQASPDLASAEVYARVLDYARSIADLVVVDTQIVEGHKSDLYAQFIMPALRSGAWLTVVSSEDYSDQKGLSATYEEFAAAGVHLDRSLLLATRWPDFTPADHQAIVHKYGQKATFVGVVGVDPAVHAGRNTGQVVYDTASARPPIHKVLHTITGDDVFAPPPAPERGRFRFGFGRKVRR